MFKLLIFVSLLFITDLVWSKPDYIYNKEVDGWLKLHPFPATWEAAFQTCHYEGAVLASPINPELAKTLRSMMNESNLDSILLGVHTFSPGYFVSIEGVPLADFSITFGNIYSTSSSSSSSSSSYYKVVKTQKTDNGCMSLSSDGKALLSSCEISLPYICYKKRDNATLLNECGTFDNEYKLHKATGSCYKHHKNPKSWVTAYRICAGEGAYLIIINNQREADAISKDYLEPPTKGNRGGATYTGIRDWTSDQTWLSIHGEKIENLFKKWAKNAKKSDPSGFYNCGLFWAQRTLETVYCEHPNNFICEKDPNTSRFQNIPV
ncbi:hypothetical protein PYW08_010998 [Mythimna loreyi]|uniref:Uncharacterized protein n=1 Tax=Mythimna loreyi TaxID=667449 RepID=A0ACC2Q264_9NEOP|nr:hypothetical protein PYW08_010998 [Mythimna loreyi]